MAYRSQYPTGVPSQFAVHVHPWPTRFHGPIYTRPVSRAPFKINPQSVFKPNDFIAGLGSRDEYPNHEAIQTDTGEGIFKPGGHGGGIFDGNISGLAGATGPVPSQCWDATGFKACHDRVFAQAQKDCPTTGYPNAAYPSYDDCVADLTATYVGPSAESTTCVSQYCPSASSSGGGGGSGYPWNAYSADTKTLQQSTNEALKAAGYCPITVDGKLGPATCGARKTLRESGAQPQMTWPSTCQTFKAPSKGPCAGSGVVAMPSASTKPAVTTASMNMGFDLKKLGAFALGAGAVLGAAYYFNKRKRK